MDEQISDAQRYQFLKHLPETAHRDGWGLYQYTAYAGVPIRGEALDKAIDTAIQAEASKS